MTTKFRRVLLKHIIKLSIKSEVSFVTTRFAIKLLQFGLECLIAIICFKQPVLQ